ncbi:hypothetical protein SEPCBS57363_002748 [Sporothrix epigloea]|uniref:Protein kinase domain-containing protein n=1 Tax=Sporothrix epigloea TaxID=1892477 RepID=A0ABP0DJC0_9PEZI
MSGDAAEAGIDAALEAVPPLPSLSSLNVMASGSQQSLEKARGDAPATSTADGEELKCDIPTFSRPVTSSGGHAHESFDSHPAAYDTFEDSHLVDTASMTSSQYERTIRYELEHVWILNLSMHFRDKSRREKFFVTYRQRPDLSRRVTISLDYRNAPDGSLEMDLLNTTLQRDKNEMIYESIRESLADIQFYNTVTNLKLQTTDGRLHVHVVEDTTEIIDYPSSQIVKHLGCLKVKESEVEFDSHMSGFVYKVRVHGQSLIKKEIPGPDSVDEFLYEVNALNFLRGSQNVIELYGVIVGDDDRVRGLLISYAEQGALIDIIYENNHGISWPTRMKWARQIVHGLSEIHEAGFVQGDFTLSNIVIDGNGNAKIIDINRRGCPVGWEPPEATPLIRSEQRISMYIGVKSDLYQLGMVLWALATQYDDPEAHGRPLHLNEDVGVPQWYRSIVETCLAEDPRQRSQALQLLNYFHRPNYRSSRYDDSDYEDEWVQGRNHALFYAHSPPSGSFDGDSNSFKHRIAAIESVPSIDDNSDKATKNFTDHERPEFYTDKFSNLTPIIRSVTPNNEWAYVNFGHRYVDTFNSISNEPYYYPTRGRSPPRDRIRPDLTRRGVSWERTSSREEERARSDKVPNLHNVGLTDTVFSIEDYAPSPDIQCETNTAVDKTVLEGAMPGDMAMPDMPTDTVGIKADKYADASEGRFEPYRAVEGATRASFTKWDAPAIEDAGALTTAPTYSLDCGDPLLEASSPAAVLRLETGEPDGQKQIDGDYAVQQCLSGRAGETKDGNQDNVKNHNKVIMLSTA